MDKLEPVVVKGVSPKGTFRYPHLTEPDMGSKEYPDPDGSFNVRLVVSESVKDAFLAKLQPSIDYAMAQADADFSAMKPAARKKIGEVSWNDVATPIYDEETEEETGDYEFRFKTKASGKRKNGKRWERKLPLFDAKGTPIKKIDAIWGGTTGKCSFTAQYYFVNGSGAAGITLYLEAAQIIDLVAGGDRDAEGFGFGEEDGYEADNSSAPFEEEDGGYEATNEDGGNGDF